MKISLRKSGLIILVFVTTACGFVRDEVAPTATSTIVPTITSVPTDTIPTRTPAPTSAPARDCFAWDSVEDESSRKNICVYGYVSKIVDYAGAWQIRFGKEGNFFLAGGTYYYPEIGEGDCVYAKGPLMISSEGVPYIQIDQDNLYYCKEWMKN